MFLQPSFSFLLNSAVYENIIEPYERKMFQRFRNRQRGQNIVLCTHWKIWPVTLMGKMIVTKIIISKLCSKSVRQHASEIQIYLSIREIGAIQPFEVFSIYESLRVQMAFAIPVSYSSSKRRKDLNVRIRKKFFQVCRE